MNDIGTIQTLDKIMSKDPDEASLIRLSTGVVLRGRKASSSVLIEVITSAKRPKPPVYFNKTMGRQMENPEDPDYIEQVQAYKYEQAGSLVTAMILLGTEIVSIPDGFEGPHPFAKNITTKERRGTKEKTKVKAEPELVWPRWIADYELLRLQMNPESESWRYLTWIKFKAAPTEEDLKQIQEVVGRLSGVREADAEAAEEFPERNQENR